MDDVRRQTQTVTAEGESVSPVPHGVRFHDVTTHVDERGSVCELFDPRWGWHPDPMVFAYTFTIRQGMAKGWGLHKEHDDRYFILDGEMLSVLYDERPDSPTYGLVSEIVLSEHRRRLMNIPAGVWHAHRNLGAKDVRVINFPTTQFVHENPDKYGLPLNNDRIPYRFEGVRGW